MSATTPAVSAADMSVEASDWYPPPSAATVRPAAESLCVPPEPEESGVSPEPGAVSATYEWAPLNDASSPSRAVAEPIVHQLNMIVATRGTSAVTSFYAPYACDACGREESRLIDAIANGAGLASMQAPPMPCPECGQTMAFNDFPERYFSFLAPT